MASQGFPFPHSAAALINSSAGSKRRREPVVSSTRSWPLGTFRRIPNGSSSTSRETKAAASNWSLLHGVAAVLIFVLFARPPPITGALRRCCAGAEPERSPGTTHSWLHCAPGPERGGENPPLAAQLTVHVRLCALIAALVEKTSEALRCNRHGVSTPWPFVHDVKIRLLLTFEQERSLWPAIPSTGRQTAWGHQSWRECILCNPLLL